LNRATPSARLNSNIKRHARRTDDAADLDSGRP
jgi:hypothetical protein